MTKRMLLMLAVVAGVLAVLAYIKLSQVEAANAQANSFRPPPEAVTTIVAREETWETTLGAIGSVEALQGVTVSADLPGVVETIAFESGERVSEGDLLVALDARQERAQLAAAEAERELASSNLVRLRGLRDKGVVAAAELDEAEALFKTAEARAGESRAAIERKTVRAPFAGILGLRQVNVGQYLSAGDPIVPLQVLQPIYVEFAVPQQEVGRLRRGTAVRATVGGDAAAAVSGRVTAIDAVIDEATRNLRVQATFPNERLLLRPGMFVEVGVLVEGTARSVIALPASSIAYAPYGDSVFVVEEMTAPDGTSYTGVRQQFVELGRTRGDQVAVVSGVAPGDEVVTSGVFKLRGGVAVQVVNDVQPANDPAPAPEQS